MGATAGWVGRSVGRLRISRTQVWVGGGNICLLALWLITMTVLSNSLVAFLERGNSIVDILWGKGLGVNLDWIGKR